MFRTSAAVAAVVSGAGSDRSLWDFVDATNPSLPVAITPAPTLVSARIVRDATVRRSPSPNPAILPRTSRPTILGCLLAAAFLAAAAYAPASHAQQGEAVPLAPAGLVLSLDQAVTFAGGSAPSADAAAASTEVARAARETASLRPNPIFQAQVENIGGTGAYRGTRSAETTVGVAIPLELGGKRAARVSVAEAQLSRAELQRAVVAADIRQQVTQLYIDALAVERRLAVARDQVRIANEASRVARVRVRAGRASPLEEQRADVARLNAEADLERQTRSTATARDALARRLGRPLTGRLDDALLDRLPPSLSSSFGGQPSQTQAAGTLTLAAADADLDIAESNVRLARANRIPDLIVGPAVRRLDATDDTAAVFTVSLPLPVFNTGRAAVAQASAERARADAQRRVIELDAAQVIAAAETEAANAATTARTASGPALAAAQEAARIARIGYREGKFGQLDLLDAERTLATTRASAIDALATYQTARARLERLTAPVPAMAGGARP